MVVYIGVSIVDNALFSNQAQIWNNDAVEIYFDMNRNRSITYQADDFQYLFGYNNTTASEHSGRLTGVAFESATITGGWSLEVALVALALN